MSEDVEIEDWDITSEINNLSQAFAVLAEIDAEILPAAQRDKLKKARGRLISVIVDYVFALPPVDEE